MAMRLCEEYFTASTQLDRETAKEYIYSIVEYYFTGNVSSDDAIVNALVSSSKYQLDADKKREQQYDKKNERRKERRKHISAKTRFEVFERDSFTCQYCGRKSPHVELSIDHIKPLSKGGTNDKQNLITACLDCNKGKGTMLISGGE